MVTLLKLSIAAAILFASASVGYDQGISPEQLRKESFHCLQNAREAYDHAWADACSRLSGGLAANGSDCSLPRLDATFLNRDWESAKNYCHQQSTAGTR